MPKALFPNALSLGNLSFGFFSMLVASQSVMHPDPNQSFLIAGILILIAALFDGIDGPVARALKVESSLGEHLDSLGDLTTFGLAPGTLMYFMYLRDISLQLPVVWFPIPVGMLVAAIYPICAAYRLARFGVTHDPKSFVGLPSPIAGVIIALVAIAYGNYHLPQWAALAVFAGMALLMVSNIKYTKPQAHFTIVRLVIFLALAGAAIVAFDWFWPLVSVLLLYVFSGVIVVLLHLVQKIKVVLANQR